MISAEVNVVAHMHLQHPGHLLLVVTGLRQRGKRRRCLVCPRINAHDRKHRILRDEHGLERKHEILRRGRYARIRQIGSVGHLHRALGDHGLLFLGVRRLCELCRRFFVIARDMVLDQRGFFAEQPVEPAEGVRRKRTAAQKRRDCRRDQHRPDRPGGLPLRFFDFSHRFVQDPRTLAILHRGQRNLLLRRIAHELIPCRLHKTDLLFPKLRAASAVRASGANAQSMRSNVSPPRSARLSATDHKTGKRSPGPHPAGYAWPV